ncbi:MAG: DNA polymerase IV [Thermoleophilia bacterium]|jgi:DNA polymerase-4|nr:DNA polymerase IV [Thermoleophilia bacterium]
MTARPSILHADLDAFYASVEQLLDPALRGRPVAVGGGVVLACSYEAKRRGVSGAMPAWRARERCPELVFVRGSFGEYRRLGDRVMEILGTYTPAVQRISIDEAFLDVGGSERLHGPPEHIALQIRRRVREEVGLPISVGAARTKHLAKIASQVAKPDGLVVVDPAREREFLDPLPVRLVWGVGPVTGADLEARGIRTIGELARASPERLAGLLGAERGTRLRALAANEDPRPVRPGGRAGSVGAQSAFRRSAPTPDLLAEVLGHLADRVAGRLRAKGLAGRTVTVRVRFADLRSVTRSITLADPVAATLTLREVAEGLVAEALADHPRERTLTLLAISVSALTAETEVQLELAVDAADDPRRPGSRTAAARLAADRSVDRVRERFGRGAIGFATVALGERAGVPDDFRELAERDGG